MDRMDDADLKEGLIPKHGGYRKLKSFQIAELIYDVTSLFCDKFINPRSRTHDQMARAARSGRKNIAEGSVDSATSKKMEMKLTGVAKGSLEELRLDYEDFLRQRRLPIWEPGHPALTRFKAGRCSALADFRVWVADEARREKENTDKQGLTQTERELDVSGVHVSHCRSMSPKDLPAVLAANGALSLLNLCIYLLDRQLKAQAAAFERDGGFTERLYKRRAHRRAESQERGFDSCGQS